MKVQLETTTQTLELLTSGAQSAAQKGMPARLWQGHVVDVDHEAMRKQLIDICNSLSIVSAEAKHGRIPASELQDAVNFYCTRLLDVATLLDESKGGIEVHAFVTRIAHKIDAPENVFDRFARELQQHVAPRPEYEKAYTLRMFI